KQAEVLREWFFKHLDRPYPTRQQKDELIKSAAITATQLEHFFCNARRRYIPDKKKIRRREKKLKSSFDDNNSDPFNYNENDDKNDDIVSTNYNASNRDSNSTPTSPNSK